MPRGHPEPRKTLYHEGGHAASSSFNSIGEARSALGTKPLMSGEYRLLPERAANRAAIKMLKGYGGSEKEVAELKKFLTEQSYNSYKKDFSMYDPSTKDWIGFKKKPWQI